MPSPMIPLFAETESFPLLDKEFDRPPLASSPNDNDAAKLASALDELSWEDQLDNGKEMSL